MQGTPSFSLKNSFSYIALTVTLGLAALLPVLFFPFIPNLFDSAKYTIVIFIALLLVIGFAVFSALRRTLEVSRSLFTVGFALLGLSTAVSIALSSPNKYEALTGSGLFFVALALLYIVLATSIKKRFTTPLVFALGAGGVLITIFSILEKVGANLFSLFGLSGTTVAGLFPNGGSLVNFSVLLIALVALALTAITQKNVATRAISISLSGVVLLGLILNGINLLPGSAQAPVLLPFSASWSIALDVLKTPRTALIGVGPQGYVQAFSLFKPIALNNTPFWAVRFGSAHNVPLDVVVTNGIIGVVALAIILLGILAKVKGTRKEDLPLLGGVAVAILLFLLIPAGPVLWVTLTLLLVAWNSASQASVPLESEDTSTFVFLSSAGKSGKDERHVATGIIAGIALLLIGGSLFGLYFNGKSIASQVVYGQALDAIRTNKAKEAYDLMRTAITIAPYHEDMRRTFSQINLSIAQGLTQKKDISEDDKKTAVTLIQQAINEAKASVALNQTESSNWLSLAIVYDNLIGAAKEADQWTVAAYTQAIIRDPANPRIRVDLGGVFRKLKSDDQASRLFEQAAQLKPDYANAYFNMASIAESLDHKDQQLALLKKTLSLLDAKDPQYNQVKDIVDKLDKEVAAMASKDGSKTATPSATPKPTPVATTSANLKDTSASASAKPKLELPADAGIATPSASVPPVPTPTPKAQTP